MYMPASFVLALRVRKRCVLWTERLFEKRKGLGFVFKRKKEKTIAIQSALLSKGTTFFFDLGVWQNDYDHFESRILI